MLESIELASFFSVGVKCGLPKLPINGFVRSSGVLLGDEAIYSCLRDHGLMGTSLRTCQEDGSWSGTTPFCQSKLYFAIVCACDVRTYHLLQVVCVTHWASLNMVLWVLLVQYLELRHCTRVTRDIDSVIQEELNGHVDYTVYGLEVHLLVNVSIVYYVVDQVTVW